MAPATLSTRDRASAGTSSSGIARLLASRGRMARGSLGLREGLVGGLALVELGGLSLDGRDPQGLLQESAGGEAVAAGVALGLHGRLAARRDRDLDDPGHEDLLLSVSPGLGRGGRGPGSAGLDDLEADAAVFEGLLADGVPLLPGLERRSLNGVRLHEAVEVLLRAPRAVVVVKLQLAGRGVARDGVEPAGQLDEQPGR